MVFKRKAFKVPSVNVLNPFAREMGAKDKFKVLRAVIVALAIFMMNLLPLLQGAAK